MIQLFSVREQNIMHDLGLFEHFIASKNQGSETMEVDQFQQ